MDQLIEKILLEFNVPGLAVGVIEEGQITLLKGYGYRDLEKSLPVTEETIFPIGSSSKSFTAKQCVELEKKGLCSLDDPICKYLPDFSFKKLTIRDLLAHRTGVPRNDPIWFYRKLNKSDVLEVLKLLDYPDDHPHSFEYNNYMYSVLGMLIEAITNQSWDENLQREILMPLGMESTNTSIDLTTKNSNHTLPYSEINGKLTKLPYRPLDAMSPAGGINSNIKDMMQWLKSQMKENKNSEMHTPQIEVKAALKPNSKISYGMGWFIQDHQGHKIVWHDGVVDGFYSKMAFCPDKKIGVVILTNSSSDGLYACTAIKNYLMDKLLNLESEDWIGKIKQIRDKNKELLKSQIIDLKDGKLTDSKSLDEFIGTYQNPAYGQIEIKKKGNHLVFEYGRDTMNLYFENEDLLVGNVHVLEVFGFPSKLNLNFKRDRLNGICSLEVPFEAMRGLPPVLFIRKSS